jgi:hypothetical protein
VSLRQARWSRASCGFVLAVETRSRTLAARVPESYKPPRDETIRDWPFAEPFVVGLVRLGSRSAQIVVAREHGASTVSVSLHGIVDGDLRQLGFRPRMPQGRLSLFGGVSTGMNNAHCLPPGGGLVLVSMWPADLDGERWFVSRSTYRLAGGTFVRASRRTVETSSSGAVILAQRWKLNVEPFTGCLVSRGRSL